MTLRKRLAYLEAEQQRMTAERSRWETCMQAELHLPLPDECSESERAECLARLVAAIDRTRAIDSESERWEILQTAIVFIDTIHEAYRCE